jgi:hypothetical protein
MQGSVCLHGQYGVRGTFRWSTYSTTVWRRGTGGWGGGRTGVAYIDGPCFFLEFVTKPPWKRCEKTNVLKGRRQGYSYGKYSKYRKYRKEGGTGGGDEVTTREERREKRAHLSV